MGALSAQQIDRPELARMANYSTAAMASFCDKSVRQLQREFLRKFGQTPEQWINDLRLKDARTLLEVRNSAKIEAIAMSLGYKHSRSFSRAFKQRFGFPPSVV